MTLESLLVLASLGVLQRQNGNMFLPSLNPSHHVLAALESMSLMATHFIHVGRRVATNSISICLPKTPIQPEAFFHINA